MLTASSFEPARRHSSASCAKTTDAGSAWTRRRTRDVWLVCHLPVSVVERPPAVRHCRRYGAGGATLTDWLATENTPASSVTLRVTM